MAEKTKPEIILPGSSMIIEVIKEATRTLEQIEKKTIAETQALAKYSKERTNLEDANRRISQEREANEALIAVLKEEARQLEVQRIASAKRLAEETAKARAIKNYERDLKVMHKRLTEQYQKVYKTSSRRSTI